MLLVDSSVWIDHFHRPIPLLREALESAEICTHELVILELASGTVRQREKTLGSLGLLPLVETVSTEEILELVENQNLHGKGLGAVDLSILASALKKKVDLLTHDRRLAATWVRLKGKRI